MADTSKRQYLPQKVKFYSAALISSGHAQFLFLALFLIGMGQGIALPNLLKSVVQRVGRAQSGLAMILSGGQSTLAGVVFLFQARMPEAPSIANVAGYVAFGAIWGQNKSSPKSYAKAERNRNDVVVRTCSIRSLWIAIDMRQF